MNEPVSNFELPIISRMMKHNEIVGVLHHLKLILENDIPGDVVELGCNVGTTSIFIRKLLDSMQSDKKFHVYDSWRGLPPKEEQDETDCEMQFQPGYCRTTKETFVQVFDSFDLKLPTIHSGWFSEIPDDEFPQQICFAFLDGDFYSSIIDSLTKTYHKVQPGGIIIIDDCGWDVLPGVERACQDFLADKPEALELTGYPNSNGQYGAAHQGGKIVKKSC